MSLAGAVSGAAAQQHVAKDDREAWLQSAWVGVQALYSAQGVSLPDARLSVGVPPAAARVRKRARAEAIPCAIWGDKARGYEVHVNPKHLDTASRAVSALHSAAQTISGKALTTNAAGLIKALPVPPPSIADTQHSDPADAGLAGTSKQSTRLLKASCKACKFVCRVARSQANRGLPICGVCYNVNNSINRLELV